MGTVHDAIDREHGTRVALKTLNHLAPTNLLRFKTEFRAAAEIVHENLVALYDLGCHEDLWFFTMERVEGVDLLAWLRKGRATPPTDERTLEEEAPTLTNATGDSVRARVSPRPTAMRPAPQLRHAFGQIVRGVRALHGAGILHLDLKPSNVLVAPDGRVVVVDFGLARPIEGGGAELALDVGEVEVGSGSETRSIVGTPTWMAPEQYSGSGISAATDWYAVGLMLYLALTGVPAFAPASIPVLWFAKRTIAPTPPETLLDDVATDLAGLALELVLPEPTARPSGEEIAQRLEHEGVPPTLARRIKVTLVGRERERALLTGILERAQRSTSVVHLVGASGVGKTALLTSLLDEARSRALVVRGRCYERENVPYNAFDGVIDALAVRLAERDGSVPLASLPRWISELARVFPVLATVPSIARAVEEHPPISSGTAILELRRRAAIALGELLGTLAAERPLVIAIDDLHWADADSADWLAKLFTAMGTNASILFACTLRPDEARANPHLMSHVETLRIDATAGAVAFDEIAVEPLAEKGAIALAEAVMVALGNASPSPNVVRAIAEEAKGNPFSVEAIAELVVRGVGTAPHVPIEDLLAERVRGLAAAERALVETLAVAGSPIPLAAAFAAANLANETVLHALWSLRGGGLVRSTGSSAGDRVGLHHDRLRESVLRSLDAAATQRIHLAVAAALEAFDGETWLFAIARHYAAATDGIAPADRLRVAALQLAAGHRARRAAAFPLAFECFEAGIALLPDDRWDSAYALALALHTGAAETAYLSATWSALDAHVEIVKARGRTILEQLVAWEVAIDACIARTEYTRALDFGLEALRHLGVDLPRQPTSADIAAAHARSEAALASVGPKAFNALPTASAPEVVAAMRIESRLSSAAYFAQPGLFQIIVHHLVTASVERGVSPATPYALAVYGIVLNAMGRRREAHTWGMVALSLIDRFGDRSLEVRTRQVLHNLVLPWTIPLASTLDALREDVEIGKINGDLEYGAYAAHSYVHNAFYAGRPLAPLLEEALAYGLFMRGYEQVNALHVHVPFEQTLRCFLGLTANRASLDGNDFLETDALARARASGSRSAELIVRLQMAIVRFHFGKKSDALECLLVAEPFLDGVVSTWHVPMFHQYFALSIWSSVDRTHDAAAEASLDALRALAADGPENFAHRVALVSAARALCRAELAEASEWIARAVAGAERGGWLGDLVVAHELAADIARVRGDDPTTELGNAVSVARRWGMADR